MPEYKQIWFPSGVPAGGDAQAGRGAFTKRHLHIDYIPLGDSGDPALTVSSNPQDITGLDVPALKVEAGVNSQGDAILIEKFSETGAFLTGEYQGADVFSVEGDGDIWNIGTMYAHKANVGGIAVAADGTTELDMTLGNLFTSTPSQNTVWSTASPVDATNGIGGELATFVVDNSGGFTVSWGTGFTGVDPIGAGDTGISVRTLQFDGTTWHQVAATEDGEAVNASGIGISGTYGDMPFVDSAGNDLDLLAAQLGSGFLVLSSRGPGQDPVWLDVLALILS